MNRRQVAYFTRDWQRVIDTVGRDDHPKYTTAFVKTVEKLADNGTDCPGADKLPEMVSLSKQINKAAADEGDLDLISQFRVLGNAWLVGAGYDPQLLG
ncbi:MAG: hypothetical protein QM779_10400 [Propionicimonas sp.]|uniref:hypothetical protein n=1 Tax=Propionicimonas sp. TaxID=1955623 RepID=UPI003D0BD0EE